MKGGKIGATHLKTKVVGIGVCFSIMLSIEISNTFFLKTGHHQLKAECKKMTIMVMGVKR